jgi:hypothetical protein
MIVHSIYFRPLPPENFNASLLGFLGVEKVVIGLHPAARSHWANVAIL